MSASLTGVFPEHLQQKILNSKVLVVGAGGIGCEILKNLVLTGFPYIEIIDLDTIDLSNLNRQFLFHREHVGKSKAEVAKESALKFNPNVVIKSYHDSILSTDYGVNFYKKFDVVLNALDNRAARNHVNRMCLNAEIPLIESGTAGYDGQVEVIKKGFSECYECTPKAKQKSFPGCTIRNTPSELIHCIVWAKHLFNQLFGESIDDEDISPDRADPEAQESVAKPNVDGDTGAATATEVSNGEDATVPESGNIKRINTRQWAKESGFDVAALFNKFFHDDIEYLLEMKNLWKTRKPPTPIKWDTVAVCQGEGDKDDKTSPLKSYQNTWTLADCGLVYADCLKKLSAAFKSGNDEPLSWDKDDQPAMDFVAAAANIRAYIFNIPRQSRFDIKSMAGNIIPAIATTNAMTAGVVVLRTFNALIAEFEKCKTVYLRLRPNGRDQTIVPDKTVTKPNPKCIICSADPAIHLRINTQKMRIKDLRDDVLIKTLNMVHPDVTEKSKGNVLISSDEDETECNNEKFLAELGVVDGVILECDDFFQNYKLDIVIVHMDTQHDEALFEVVADANQLKPKEEAKTETEEPIAPIDDGPSTSKKRRIQKVEESDDDDCVIQDDVDENNGVAQIHNTIDDKPDIQDNVCVIEDDDDDDQVTAQVTKATDALQVTSPDKSATASLKRKQPETIDLAGDDDDDEIVNLDSDEDVGPTQSKRTRVSLTSE